MKIRNGFVSNSSSSSFILAIDESENVRCPHCGRRDPDFFDLMEKFDNDGETQINAIGYKEVIEALGGYDGDYYVAKVKSYHEKYPEEQIVYCDISYHNEMVKELIDGSPKITVIDTFE